MCGIAGVRKFGDDPITGEELVILLCSIEHRGLNATGIALQQPDGSIKVHKAPMPAWRFTKSDEFLAFLDKHLTEGTQTALLHTRAATHGNPEINSNNHPIWDGKTAIIHNGIFNNHDWLFNNQGLKRICETDSDIVRALVDRYGFDEKAIRELNKLAGSAAIACISEKWPGKLLLARSGSPLVFGYNKEGSKMYWASEAQAINRAHRPFVEVRGTYVQEVRPDIYINSMPNDTAFVFGEENLEHHQKFSTCSYYHRPDYSKGRESYHAKKKRWKKEQKQAAASSRLLTRVAPDDEVPKGAYIQCPNCGAMLRNDKGVPWWRVKCPTCKCMLASKED